MMDLGVCFFLATTLLNYTVIMNKVNGAGMLLMKAIHLILHGKLLISVQICWFIESLELN